MKFLRRQLRQRLARGADDFRFPQLLRGAGAMQLRLHELRVERQRAFRAGERVRVAVEVSVGLGVTVGVGVKVGKTKLVAEGNGV